MHIFEIWVICVFFQMRVKAIDGAGRLNTVSVVVTVTRNRNAPSFNPTNYEKTIQDNEPLASSFLQVKATDKDKKVSKGQASSRSYEML